MSGDNGQGKSGRVDFTVYALAQQDGLPGTAGRQCFKMLAGLVGELCSSLRDREKGTRGEHLNGPSLAAAAAAQSPALPKCS